MNITVNLGSWFKKYYEGNETLYLTPTSGASLSDCIAMINYIPFDEIGMIAVNGVRQQDSYILNDGDLIKIYPVIISG